MKSTLNAGYSFSQSLAFNELQMGTAANGANVARKSY